MMRLWIHLLAVLGLILLCRSAVADEEEERKKDEAELAKAMEKFAPFAEKEEWAIKRKKQITDLVRFLGTAERIDLFRLNCRPLTEADGGEKGGFHGYEITAGVRVSTKDNRKCAADFLGRTLHWNDLRMAFCFNPRHGMRVKAGKRTVEFLICFECNRVTVHENGETKANLALAFTVKNHLIEKLLAAAEKPEERK